MRAAEGPGGREAFGQKVVERLHRAVVEKTAVLMDRRDLTAAEEAEAAARRRAAVGAWSPRTTHAAEQRHRQER